MENLIGQKVMTATGTKVNINGKKDDKTPDAAESASVSGSVAELAKRAQTLFDSAQSAQRQGDWAKYGSDIKKLGEVISQLEKRSK